MESQVIPSLKSQGITCEEFFKPLTKDQIHLDKGEFVYTAEVQVNGCIDSDTSINDEV